MSKVDEAERKRHVHYSSIILVAVGLIAVIVAGWGLATVSTASQVRTSDFVTLPNQPLSNQGSSVEIVGLTAIIQKSVAVGVEGYLQTTSGTPLASATVYFTYYLDFNYRTQQITTDQNGFFQVFFPMNWTGWLPLTATYFGDAQHQGLKRAFSVAGEPQ